MAQKVQVILTDDTDGSQADDTVQFSLDGVSYEIDLSDANADSLRGVLGPYVLAGRRTGGRYRISAAKATGRSRGAAHRADLSEVRSWARENGYQVSDRGRVAEEIKAAYQAAH